MNTQPNLRMRPASPALDRGEPVRALAQLLHRWPQWIGYGAAAWSVTYALLALWWLVGHPGLPSAFADPARRVEPVGWGALERAGADAAALLGLVSAAIAFRGSRRNAHHNDDVLLSVTAWGLAATLLLGVPDAQAIAVLAYSPFLLLGAPFGWPPVSLAFLFPWPVVHQLLCVVGGILWGGTAVAATRRALRACPRCGRRARSARWTSRAAAAQWGRVATVVAVVIPLLYATTRLAWAVGIPLGITEEFLREGQAIGMWTAGAALASVAIGGAVLTTGLVLRWGEVFPRWIPVWGGRAVPPSLAIAPASVMSCLFLAAGLNAVGSFLEGGFPAEGWGTTAPTLLWPLWGIALGSATLAYRYRRRGRCERCGRG